MPVASVGLNASETQHQPFVIFHRLLGFVLQPNKPGCLGNVSWVQDSGVKLILYIPLRDMVIIEGSYRI